MMMKMNWNQMGRMMLMIEWPFTAVKLHEIGMAERVYVSRWKWPRHTAKCQTNGRIGWGCFNVRRGACSPGKSSHQAHRSTKTPLSERHYVDYMGTGRSGLVKNRKRRCMPS